MSNEEYQGTTEGALWCMGNFWGAAVESLEWRRHYGLGLSLFVFKLKSKAGYYLPT